MQKELIAMRTAKVIWVFSTVTLLVVTLYFYDSVAGRDADILLIYGMLALTFPSGFLAAGLFSLLNYVAVSLGFSLSTSPYGVSEIVLTWLGFVLCGYFQWFVVIPKLFRRIWKSPAI